MRSVYSVRQRDGIGLLAPTWRDTANRPGPACGRVPPLDPPSLALGGAPGSGYEFLRLYRPGGPRRDRRANGWWIGHAGTVERTATAITSRFRGRSIKPEEQK